jgi:polyisoprenoid-binding protein YceI
VSRRTLIIIVAVALLVIIAAGVSYATYFASRINPSHTPQGVAKACGTPIPTDGLRTFRIVPGQTTASYKVHENLIIRNLPNNDAIGKTQAVQGSFSIHTGSSPLVASMNITVDLRTLKSDIAQRDFYVRENFLESDTYPYATFVSTCAQGLPASYTDNQNITFHLTGNLTAHGKTNQETFTITGRLSGNEITGTATTTIFMSDFGISPPNIANFVVADNKTILTFDFTAQEGTASIHAFA